MSGAIISVHVGEMMSKEGRLDELMGKNCYYGLVGYDKFFLGCKKNEAYEEAIRLSNIHKTGVLILQEVGVIRYSTKEQFSKMKKARKNAMNKYLEKWDMPQ